MQAELESKLRKMDDDINIKVTDIKDRIASEISNLTVTNPNLLKGTVDMSTIPESTVGDDNNWRRMDGIGGKYQEMSLGGYRYTGSNQGNGYNKLIVGSYPPGYFKKGKYVWSFHVKTNTPGFVLHTYCDPKVNIISDIRLDDVSVGTFSNNEFSFRLPDTDEHIISYHFEVVNESNWLRLGLLRYEADTVGAITDTYKWKVEEGVKRTPWCPNFQDPSPEWSTYKQTNDSNLAELNKRVTAATGETNVLKTRVEQTSNEIKITAQNLENRLNSSAASTTAELRVIKDSISAKVSRTDLDTVNDKVTAVESTLTARVDGIESSVNRVTRDVDGRITSAVSSAITQSEQGITSRINSVLDDSKRYTDTQFRQVDGKIQTQITSRLNDYARTSDVASRITQEAGKIKTELSSLVDDNISRNSKFQEVLQTVDLYKSTLGSTQNGITTSISQLIQNSDEIKTVITNAAESNTNLIMDTDTFASARFDGFSNGVDGYTTSAVPGLYGSNEFFHLSKTKMGQASTNQAFVSLPLAIDKMTRGENYTFSCRYKLDTTNAFRSDKPMTAELQILDKVGSPIYLKSLSVNPGNVVEANLTETFPVDRDRYFDNVNGFGQTGRFPFRIKLIGDGRIGVKEIMLVKGKTAGPYKPAGGVSSTVVTQRANAWALTLKGPKDVITSINADTSGLRLKGKSIVLDGDVIANGTAFIKESWIQDLNASKITAGELNAARVKVINIDASNIVSGTMSAARVRGGELRALNDATVFDLASGTLNLYSNTGTIRRIDETSSSQFLKFTRSGFIAERFIDNKAAMIVLGTNHDKSENTDNVTFSGIRLWSGSGNGHAEELFEVVSDRIIFYANGKWRSPWVIHNNTQDGNTFLIPMNEKNVKHYLGRGDKHFMGVYTDNLYLGAKATNAGGYLWDLLTCFGIISRYGWDLKNGSVQTHIRGVLNTYGFK